MTERRATPRETNPLVVLLAELAIAIERREREAAERRGTIRIVEDARRRGGKVA